MKPPKIPDSDMIKKIGINRELEQQHLLEKKYFNLRLSSFAINDNGGSKVILSSFCSFFNLHFRKN